MTQHSADRRARDRSSDLNWAAREAVRDAITEWFAHNRRDLPWRATKHRQVKPWAVLVSEFMLQQTPVNRVLPVFETWLNKWPTPAALAAASTGEAVRAWGRLGYPRRALRLHGAAVAITERHGGVVPAGYDELLDLPGIGDYTAAAIVSFAFGGRAVVLDTNVRRVFARVFTGQQFPAKGTTAAERRLGQALLPDEDAHLWAAATMELGALVCTARSPRCPECPVSAWCNWRLADYPAHDGPARKGQSWDGTDRQCRGRLLAIVRDAKAPVAAGEFDLIWPDQAQRERCIDTLLDDQLIELTSDGRFTLPV